MQNSDYHIPVLLHDCLEALAIKPNGVYVDLTFGGGGHSAEILKRLDKGKLYGFDIDPDISRNLLDDERFTWVKSNFRYLAKMLRLEGVKKVDGVLADLGISSFQIDEPERGFSIRYDGELDMRLGKAGKSALDVLNDYDLDALTKVLREYGEIRNAYTVAKEIVSARGRVGLRTTHELVELIRRFGGKKQNQFLAQVFQAIRIEVNDEIGALKEMLMQLPEVLNPGGRIAIMSYHSLEDRLVKRFIRNGSFDSEPTTDMYGNILRELKPITGRPIVADAKERERNPRSRSAKLRVAEKI